ncbi:MAG: ABC transporter ATP-binding protein [Ilumatobacteraceae bacterium]
MAPEALADAAVDVALSVDSLDVTYGVIHAVQSVSLDVRAGTITALVGSNGAGKSSILKAIAGVQAARGTVLAGNADISRLPARRRVIEHGVVLVPEGRSAFTTMSVAENLELGARVGRIRTDAGAASAFTLDEAYELFPVLFERRARRAQVLSGGEQQMLAIARSLLMAPSVLLIDEPSMGLAPLLVRRIFEVMGDVFRRHAVSVLLVEQDTAVALALATDAYLLEQGRITAHAPAAELRDDPRLRAAYLGATDALGKDVPEVGS